MKDSEREKGAEDVGEGRCCPEEAEPEGELVVLVEV
jgi:hypothetical protein